MIRCAPQIPSLELISSNAVHNEVGIEGEGGGGDIPHSEVWTAAPGPACADPIN